VGGVVGCATVKIFNEGVWREKKKKHRGAKKKKTKKSTQAKKKPTQKKRKTMDYGTRTDPQWIWPGKTALRRGWKIKSTEPNVTGILNGVGKIKKID